MCTRFFYFIIVNDLRHSPFLNVTVVATSKGLQRLKGMRYYSRRENAVCIMYNFFLSQMCFFFTLRLATSIFSSRSSCCLHSKKTSEANEVKEALPLQQEPIELASPLWRDAVGHNSGPLGWRTHIRGRFTPKAISEANRG